MTVVFSGLLLLFILMTLFQRVETRKESNTAAAGAQLEESHTSSLSHSGAVSPEVVAVISAAITASLGHKIRVRRIRYRSPSDSSWSRQGRVTIMGSHYVKR
jgi:Na+-transporting methylmalonyl-CoA/oxaloacetate decarboxylase gamma subunit